jgi:hypothetical protein
MSKQPRSIRAVPKTVMVLLMFSLAVQIVWHTQLPKPRVEIEKLKAPPKIEWLHVLSFGDSVVSAKLLMLWLQAFDSQQGQFLSYRQLDYHLLQQWLERILQIDPHSQYPLLAASHLYSMVPNADKKRLMLEFVYQQFFHDPTKRWRWLAQAAVLAKHRLNDLPLALKYAKALTDHATPDMPRWAQEMQIFILEDMGELERARLVIGGMLASGELTEPNEIKFLNQKLLALKKKSQ